MYKLHDCFLESGVFNEALIKRFKDSYDPENGSHLWMIPGHVVYTTPDLKVYTCDARPLDLLSPSEPCTGELIAIAAPVIEIFFDTENESPRMYIALTNGDVQIFEYRALLYEWARVGYFNVNIVSPNSTTTTSNTLTKVLISPQQSTIYWTEASGTDQMNITLFKRTLPAYGVREITQSTLGPMQILLKNLPNFEIIDIQGNIFIIPELPNSVNLYITISTRCYIWLFDITGKCLWRGMISDQPLDFVSLCIQSVGLWSSKGKIKVCKLLHNNQKSLYIIHDDILLSISVNGEICKQTKLPFTLDELHDYYILWNVICAYTKDSLKIYGILTGELFQTIDIQSNFHIYGMLYHRASLPYLGFYTESTILTLQPESLQVILNSKAPSYSKVLHLLTNGNVHMFAVMKDLVNFPKEDLHLEPLQKIPTAFQSKALLIAIIELCREKGIDNKNFPFSSCDLQSLLNVQNDKCPDTRLKELLEPLVDCYCKLENAKTNILHAKVNSLVA